MRTQNRHPLRWALVVFAAIWMLVIIPISAAAAPYAALVMDARNGKVLHARNADTRLHPASLTKMMTLYVVFEAVEHGEISLDTVVRVSKHAASEPPSKLGLRAGQKIRVRHLIRAAAIKSANDAATALGEAVSGSEAKFARRMNRTARALGMTRTSFKNAHGLTEAGHLSTARDMSILGRHLFYDYPDYYNLFSRISANTGVGQVYNTNRRMLRNYRGADGIKTGYTRAAGYNLTASAERGNKRIIATVFGGRSTASRNAKVAELLDLGFKRSRNRVALKKPSKPLYAGKIGGGSDPSRIAAGKTTRLLAAAAVKKSKRPQLRATGSSEEAPVIAAKADIENALQQAFNEAILAETQAIADAKARISSDVKPKARPEEIAVARAAQNPIQHIVTRVSTSGGRHWGINVGQYESQYKARKILLKTALNEIETLDGSRPKVVKRSGGFDANFMGLTNETAELACRRLQAKQIDCSMIEPGA
ncbi:MAG: D-alanyl-D-alanine carboxypeptidase family protein [Pseudomonadota bacterium]